ncbi:ABC transporter permease [Euzebya pacifica]|uniref:ABC transporter permease n=1 Tax=Euzebya pacifica TaxID=1608957 RepID=UPI0013DF7EBB|nr:ABC transporter permease [Euzebya pacifica]
MAPTNAPGTVRGVWLRYGDQLILALVIIGSLVMAQIAATNGWVSQFILPKPTDVWASLVDGFTSGVYWPHISSTLLGTGLGFAFAAVGAMALAALMVTMERVENVVLPLVVGFQSLPKIAVAPIVILWLGFDLSGKVVIVGFVCFFPILLNTLAGLKIRDREQLELLQSLGATKLQMFRYLRLPGAVPYLFAGFHVGIIFALLGAVVAEFVGSRDGLGRFLLSQRAAFNVGGVYAVLVILMVMGLVFRWIMLLIERRFAFWAEDVSHRNV